MDSGNSSCSKTQSRLVRANNIMDLSNGSCSRTRSGLVRRKKFMGSSDDSCSRTRSGLVRRKGFMESSNDSCSRTRSGLVRRKGFIDSSDGSGSGTQSGLVRGSPSIKALIMGGPVRKGLPDADGHLIEETPSRTRSGLIRQSPIVKGPRCTFNGWQREDMPIAARSGLVRGNPAIKTLREDEPVIKGLADGWLKEDKPLGTRSGLVRGRLAVKALTKVGSVTKEQHDVWLREDKPVETQSGIVREDKPVETQRSNAAKTLDKDESVTKGLPDGWWKEYRPRKPGSSQKNDPYYIDPVSGYEFRSLKDVYRYLQTGDIRHCIVRPKRGTLHDVCITKYQTHTSSSSQQTRPGTADKAIQCEILTSEGIMLPWEELFTPHRGKNTEHIMSPESESMKVMEQYGNRLETLQQNGVQPFAAQHAPRKTESIKRKSQNVEVKSKKSRSEASPAVTPLRMSHRLAALDAQSEASIEPGDQPISINLVNHLQTVEANNNDLSKMNQSSAMNKIHGNDETFNQLGSSQEVTVNRIQAMHENTTNLLQRSQVDAVNSIHMNQNQENTDQLWSSLPDTDIRMRAVRGYTSDQTSQAETMNHKQANMENTFNQLGSNRLADTLNHIAANQENTAAELQSSLEDTSIPTRNMEEYTMASQEDTMNHIQMNRENTANQLQTSIADTIVPIRSTKEFTSDHSQPSSADSMNQRQANQTNTADELQLGQSDTVTQIQMMQNNMTNLSQPSQANSLNQIDINLEYTANHLEPNYAENPLVQTGFSWAPEQNGGALVTDFWTSVENQDSSVPMQIDGVPVASFPANVKFQSSAAAAAVPTTQATIPVTVSDQSGLVIPSLFGNAWSDPCIEFAFKTLTGDVPVLDDTAAVTDYFPQQQDLNKGTTPNCSGSALDNNRTHTQVDINLPLPRPSDKLYNGSWFPPQ